MTAFDLMCRYLDFIHGPERGPPARKLFDAYLGSLLEATGEDRIRFASNFHHPSWRREVQFIVNYGQDRAPLDVISGYVEAAREGPVHSFHNLAWRSNRDEPSSAAYWNKVENVANLKAGIARADYSWWPAARGKPNHEIKLASLSLEALRRGPGAEPPKQFPPWLRTKNRPRKATKAEAFELLQRLQDAAPAPFWIPLEIFQKECANKVALLAQYLEAQGLRPRQVAEALRLGDIQDDGQRPPSKLMFDWRTRHRVRFERRLSRYEVAEPPSHLTHVRFCGMDWSPSIDAQ